MTVRAYPFDLLPRLSREQVRTLPTLRRALAAVDLGEICRAAGPLLGVPTLSAVVEPARIVPRASLAQALSGPFVAAVLTRASGGPDERFALECGSAGAGFVVDRLLGGDGSAALAHGPRPLDDMSRGALAYLAARILAAQRGGYVLRDLLTDADVLADVLGDDVLVAPVLLHTGAERIAVRALLPAALLRRLPASVQDEGDRSWLADLALALWADGGEATLPLSAATTLAAGDVLVLDGSGLVYDADVFSGSVALRVEGSSTAFVGAARDREIVVDSISRGGDTFMTTGKLVTREAEPAPSDALAVDAPIELRVELARFTITLGELSRLRAGDVLITGRRIGEAVTLRAGARALAQGELVDVDGEIGVRVLRVLDQSAIV